MLVKLLWISALLLGVGFAAGLASWAGLVLRTAFGRRRRPIVAGAAASVGEPEARGFGGPAPGSGATYPARVDGPASEWGRSAPTRREGGGWELLTFPE